MEVPFQWILIPSQIDENIFDSLTTVLVEYLPQNTVTVDSADYYLNRNSRVIAEQFSILINKYTVIFIIS